MIVVLIELRVELCVVVSLDSYASRVEVCSY